MPSATRSATSAARPAAGWLATTPAQQAMWLLEQTRAVGSSDSLPLAVELAGPLDRDALAAAIAHLSERHPALRIEFGEQRGALVRRERKGARQRLESETVDDLAAAVTERSAQPIALLDGLPWSATLLDAPSRPPLLLLVFHHAIFDGSSKDILLDDLARLYAALAAGAPAPAAPATVADLLAAERAATVVASADAERHWREVFAALAETERPFPQAAAPRSGGPSRGGTAAFEVDPRLRHAIAQLATASATSTYVVLLAAFLALGHRYGDARGEAATAVALGTRTDAAQELVGLFVNEAPLTVPIDAATSFRELVGATSERLRALLTHRRLPFARVVAERPGAGALLPSTSIGYRRAAAITSWRPLQATAHRLLPHHGNRWPLALQLLDEDERLHGRFDVDPAVVPADLGVAVPQQFLTLLAGACAAPDRAVARLPLLDEQQLGALSRRAAGPPAPLPRCAGVHELVERQAAAWPDRTALITDAATLTYAQLNRRANLLARRLRARGAGPGEIVGVFLEPGFDAVAATLATLKSGAAQLPLDPAYPAERIAFMLDDSDATCVLTSRALRERLPQSVTTVTLDEETEAAAADDGDVARSGSLDEAAFVLYTSGSTGAPKGVLGTHRTIVSRVLHDLVPLVRGERICAKTSASFIDSLWELFAPLAHGEAVVVADAAQRRDPAALVALLERHAVTRIVLVPSLLEAILRLPTPLERQLERLRLCSSSGEALSPELRQRFCSRLPHVRLVNLYGTSECWDATWHVCQPEEETVPIGVPLSGAEVWLLDAAGERMPAGLAGELCVGGAGVARGYLGREQLTRERFIAPPWDPARRLYRTGDRARLRGDGALELLGRVDLQVKIRGHRIEPGEIEAQLRAHPAVEQAAVVARRAEPTGALRLAAYVTGAPVSRAELRAHLRARLPEAAIPTVFASLDALPLTPSGKLDRRRLPTLEAIAAPTSFVAPSTATERRLAAIWTRLLDLPAVSADGEWFELGGDSLSAIELIGTICDDFAVPLPLSALYEEPTLSQLAERIDRLAQAPAAPLPRAARRAL